MFELLETSGEELDQVAGFAEGDGAGRVQFIMLDLRGDDMGCLGVGESGGTFGGELLRVCLFEGLDLFRIHKDE